MNKDKIQAIENEDGMMLFRMAFTHLMDVGYRHLQDKAEIEATCGDIQRTTSPHSIMTADFQCRILECAHELAQFDIQDLLRYVKTDFAFDGLTIGIEETKWKEHLANAVYCINREILNNGESVDEILTWFDDNLSISKAELIELGIYREDLEAE